TRAVVRLIARLEHKPAVLVSGSAIGWDGLWQGENLTEVDGGQARFTHRPRAAWGRGAPAAERPGGRGGGLRIRPRGGAAGGVLSRLLTPFEFGLGGRIGNGRQWMSWIERDDVVRLIAHVVATASLSGAVNATAPEPVTNATFTRELARALRRPALLPIPAALLRGLAGALAAELLIGGQRVLPDKAHASGFAFRHPTLDSALSAMLGTRLPGRRDSKPRYFGSRIRTRGLSLQSSLAVLAARHRLSDDRLLR